MRGSPEFRLLIDGGYKACELSVVSPEFPLVSPEVSHPQATSIRRAQRSGRPLGSTDFVDDLEETLGRKLRKGKPGPKARIK